MQIPQIAKFMGPTWGPPGSYWPQMGPMLAPGTFLLGTCTLIFFHFLKTFKLKVKYLHTWGIHQVMVEQMWQQGVWQSIRTQWSTLASKAAGLVLEPTTCVAETDRRPFKYILKYNLVRSLSHENCVKNCPFDLVFYKCLSSIAAEALVKYQSDTKG